MNGPDITARVTYSGHMQTDAVVLVDGTIIGGVTLTPDDDGWLTTHGADLAWADSGFLSFLDDNDANEDSFVTREDLILHVLVAVNTAACVA